MYIYESLDENIFGSGLYIYTLKDGPISDINPNIVNITNGDTTYTPLFLNLPPDLPNGRSDQLWMLSGLHESVIKNKDLDEEHWTGQIVNDNELKFGNGFISKPDYKNFPKSGFTATIVNNDNNPTLHVIGGLIYSKELKTELITNYHFKYEFKTDKWSDLSKTTKSILPPVTYHKVIQAENSLILITGLSQNYTKNGNFTHTLPSENSTQSSISEIYKFDLNAEKWSLVNAKLNLEEEQYGRGQAEGLSLDIYNEKLISYMTLFNMESGMEIPKLATLDYNAKDWEWTWIDVKNVGGTDNSLNLMYQHTLVINDQLLLFHGVSNQKANKKIYSIDLKTNNLIGSVNVSGKNGQSTNSGLPTWAIILISVICVIIFIIILAGIWLYLRYKKRINQSENNGQKMQDIWAESNVEAKGNAKGDTALTFGNKITSTGETCTELNEDSIMGYDCFKHEIDLQDMEDTKIHNVV